VVANSVFVFGFHVVLQLQKFSEISKFSEAFSPSLRRLLAGIARFGCYFLFEERKSVFYRPAGRKILGKNDKEILRVDAPVRVDKRG